MRTVGGMCSYEHKELMNDGRFTNGQTVTVFLNTFFLGTFVGMALCFWSNTVKFVESDNA
jgi:hypothetical protein